MLCLTDFFSDILRLNGKKRLRGLKDTLRYSFRVLGDLIEWGYRLKIGQGDGSRRVELWKCSLTVHTV